MGQGTWSTRNITIAIGALALIAAGLLFRWEVPRVQLAAEPIFTVGGFPVTNTMLATWLAMLAVIGFFWAATRHLSMVPGRLQGAAEIVLEVWLDLSNGAAGPRYARKFLAVVVTIFMFVLAGNWMGLIPGYNTIGIWHQAPGEARPELVPILRGATTDLNVTVALALISVAMTQIWGVGHLGLWRYLGKFVNLREGAIGIFVGLLELISEFARIISLSFRLFGNIFAGEVLLTVIAFLVPYVVALPFLGLEVFVGAVQAFIFAMLTLVFGAMAVTAHDGEAESESPEHAH